MILLDIEMPRMDGLTFLRKMMADDPMPVVICSALAGRGSGDGARALEEGAVEIVGQAARRAARVPRRIDGDAHRRDPRRRAGAHAPRRAMPPSRSAIRPTSILPAARARR